MSWSASATCAASKTSSMKSARSTRATCTSRKPCAISPPASSWTRWPTSSERTRTMNFNIDPARGDVVLVVDDVPENLAVLHDALDESGYTVLVANNGATALQRAAEAQPDIILLDAVMPGMDGFETCRHLKASLATRHIPVVFMTGLTEAEHVVAAFAAGGNDYVTKPLRTSEVLARIAAHMQTARLMDQARSALDAFGNAVIAMTPRDGKIVWQTPLARTLMQGYFYTEGEQARNTPAELAAWLEATQAAH